MEQLIFFLLIVVASIISGWLQERQKRKQAHEEIDQAARERSNIPPYRPERKPQTADKWQEELRRLLEGDHPALHPKIPPDLEPKLPPPIITPPPVVIARQAQVSEGDLKFGSTLPVSAVAFDRAATLHNRPEERLKQTAELIQTRGYQSHLSSSDVFQQTARKWRSNPHSLREAILATVVLGPPKSETM